MSTSTVIITAISKRNSLTQGKYSFVVQRFVSFSFSIGLGIVISMHFSLKNKLKCTKNGETGEQSKHSRKEMITGSQNNRRSNIFPFLHEKGRYGTWTRRS